MVKIMPRMEREDRSSRALVPFSLKNSLIIRRLSYRKLPKKLIKVSVLKLDGSSYDVEVSRNATVGELKIALEEGFSLWAKEDRCQLPWSPVWGYFCLCYEGQKLVNDKVRIRRIGIKDGDQLQFVRHVSVNHKPAKQRSKNLSVDSEPFSTFLSRSSTREDTKQRRSNGYANIENQEINLDHYPYEEDENIPMPKSKLVHFFKGWLSHPKLWIDIS